MSFLSSQLFYPQVPQQSSIPTFNGTNERVFREELTRFISIVKLQGARVTDEAYITFIIENCFPEAKHVKSLVIDWRDGELAAGRQLAFTSLCEFIKKTWEHTNTTASTDSFYELRRRFKEAPISNPCWDGLVTSFESLRNQMVVKQTDGELVIWILSTMDETMRSAVTESIHRERHSTAVINGIKNQFRAVQEGFDDIATSSGGTVKAVSIAALADIAADKSSPLTLKEIGSALREYLKEVRPVIGFKMHTEKGAGSGTKDDPAVVEAFGRAINPGRIPFVPQLSPQAPPAFTPLKTQQPPMDPRVDDLAKQFERGAKVMIGPDRRLHWVVQDEETGVRRLGRSFSHGRHGHVIESYTLDVNLELASLSSAVRCKPPPTQGGESSVGAGEKKIAFSEASRPQPLSEHLVAASNLQKSPQRRPQGCLLSSFGLVTDGIPVAMIIEEVAKSEQRIRSMFRQESARVKRRGGSDLTGRYRLAAEAWHGGCLPPTSRHSCQSSKDSQPSNSSSVIVYWVINRFIIVGIGSGAMKATGVSPLVTSGVHGACPEIHHWGHGINTRTRNAVDQSFSATAAKTLEFTLLSHAILTGAAGSDLTNYLSSLKQAGSSTTSVAPVPSAVEPPTPPVRERREPTPLPPPPPAPTSLAEGFGRLSHSLRHFHYLDPTSPEIIAHLPEEYVARTSSLASLAGLLDEIFYSHRELRRTLSRRLGSIFRQIRSAGHVKNFSSFWDSSSNSVVLPPGWESSEAFTLPFRLVTPLEELVRTNPVFSFTPHHSSSPRVTAASSSEAPVSPVDADGSGIPHLIVVDYLPDDPSNVTIRFLIRLPFWITYFATILIPPTFSVALPRRPTTDAYNAFIRHLHTVGATDLYIILPLNPTSSGPLHLPGPPHEYRPFSAELMNPFNFYIIAIFQLVIQLPDTYLASSQSFMIRTARDSRVIPPGDYPVPSLDADTLELLMLDDFRPPAPPGLLASPTGFTDYTGSVDMIKAFNFIDQLHQPDMSRILICLQPR
ncbi:hypothetical protein BC829DRAFT_446397 [Chytridium lagenaria]|nr:hypothetical protein BC829DRAFT_446397 [Chytridium lagenaria]